MKTEDNKSVLKINFGGKEISLSMDKAKKYIKAGLKAEKHSDALSTLEFLAAREKKTPAQFMTDLKLESDKTLKTSIKEKVNGDENLAQTLFEMENQKANGIHLKNDNKKDFSVVTKYFPEFKTIEDLPDEAVVIKELNDISFFDAILRYRFLQQKKIKKEQLNREKNRQGTAGSLKNNDTGYGAAVYSAMLKGIRK